MESWYKARIHQGRALLGHALVPFSLDHLDAFLFIESPFVTGKHIPSWADLGTALLLCSTPEPLAALNRVDVQRGSLFWLVRWFLPSLLQPACKAFGVYLSDYYAMPRVDRPVDEDGDDAAVEFTKMPWTAKLRRNLTRNWGMSWSEACRCPVGLAVHLALTDQEARGDKLEQIVSDEDAAMYAAQAKALAEK